jgi:hypothetical protein
MFGIQVQPVTALQRDAVLRGPTSIFVPGAMLRLRRTAKPPIGAQSRA